MDPVSAAGSRPTREELRIHLEAQLERPIVIVDLPDGADKDLEEARRRLSATWPSIIGNWERLTELGRKIGGLRQEKASLPVWKVLQGYRISAEEQRLEAEQSGYGTRFEGLFKSALDNYQMLVEGGGDVQFLESDSEGA